MGGLKAAAGPIASRLLGDPGARLRVVACTGTNGKTSSAWWIAQAMTRLGMRCGVVGTLGIGEPPVAADGAPAALAGDGLTTPDPVALQNALRAFVDAGVVGVAIEASSIGIAEHRARRHADRHRAVHQLTQTISITTATGPVCRQGEAVRVARLRAR